MKPIHLLVAFLVFIGLGLQAQSTTTVEKNSKRITITTTKLDDQGKPVTETWIAEGEAPEAILQNMAINPEILEKVDAEKISTAPEGERLFLFRKAGDHEAIEGRLNDISDKDKSLMEKERSIYIYSQGGDDGKNVHKIARIYDVESPMAWGGHTERKANCAALGVYVTYSGDMENGCRITSLIEHGGAKEGGLQEGDVITKLDDYVITDFPTLYEALAHYLPGDEATVYYQRNEQNAKTVVNLKSWADLPGHEFRARGDCGKVENFKEEENEPQLLDDPNGLSGTTDNDLLLKDARIYPNPTDGLFAFSFSSEPGPVTISISDVSGKVVYTEENDNDTGYYNRDINLKGVAPGNYIVTVKQNDKVFTQQISKQ
jgi:hypothetical protein